MTKRFYRPELDVVRLIAFLSVFLHHSAPRIEAGHKSIIVSVVNAAGFGLCLFFVLSAFLITTLLLREYESTGDIHLAQFYKRRALRIWPLYFGALLGAMIWSLHLHTLYANHGWFIAAFLMGGNLVARPETIATHLWSISIEEQFYVFWPSLMKRVKRFGLFVTAFVMIASANVALVHYGMIHADTDQTVWCSTIVQFEMFAAGILLALAHAKREIFFCSAWQRIVGILAVPLLWFTATFVFRVKGEYLFAVGPISLCLGYALVAGSCALLIAAVLGVKSWPRWMIELGKISYGLYVYHLPVLYFLAREVHWVSPIIRRVLALFLTCGFAWLSYRYYETPFLRLKERFEFVKSRPVEN
jgi:peptidoglycan/LPS O-acetylase OafA/YrhL